MLEHVTQRYTWFKNEAILLLSRVGQVDHRKERNNGPYIYIKDTVSRSLPGQLRYCDTLLQFIIPRFQEAWSQLARMFISVISLHRAALHTSFSVPVPTPDCPLWSAVPKSSAFSQEARNSVCIGNFPITKSRQLIQLFFFFFNF